MFFSGVPVSVELYLGNMEQVIPRILWYQSIFHIGLSWPQNETVSINY